MAMPAINRIAHQHEAAMMILKRVRVQNGQGWRIETGFRGALRILVMLILIIACANLANLMMAQASARAREMALRVAIGAGRWRLVQLVLVESALIAICGAMLGGAFAWWSAPLVVRMINPPDHPVRLVLPARTCVSSDSPLLPPWASPLCSAWDRRCAPLL